MAKKVIAKEVAQEDNTGTIVASCVCRSTYQDERYGYGKRLFNKNMKEKGKHEARCTVCGTKKVIT